MCITVHPQFKVIHQHRNQSSSEEDDRIQSLYQHSPLYPRKKKKTMQGCSKVKLTSKKHMTMNPDMTQMCGWSKKNLKSAIRRVYVFKEKMVLMSEQTVERTSSHFRNKGVHVLKWEIHCLRADWESRRKHFWYLKMNQAEEKRGKILGKTQPQ